MSRIAKNVIVIPENVQVKFENDVIVFTGPKGNLNYDLSREKALKIDIELKDQTLAVKMPSEVDKKSYRKVHALTGTLRAHLYNYVIGVSKGFTCHLILVRVGARAQIEENNLIINIGYSNPKKYIIPQDVVIKIISATEIAIEGVNIQRVNQTAAEIIEIRKPEPYKGTGILKKGQVIKLKAAKKK